MPAPFFSRSEIRMTENTDQAEQANQAEPRAEQAKRRKRGRPYTFHQARGTAKLARALERRGALRLR
jgi:hypothetical protein